MNSTRVDDTRGQRIAYLALIAFTVAVGVVTFVLSFYGLRDYGVRVERLSPELATLVPVGVDILSLCGVAGTYLLRNERARVRAYAWLVFGTAVALSVAGNITHAAAQRLDSAGMVGAAAWPILLALAAHFVIVTRRALERSAQLTEPPAAQSSGLASDPDPERSPTAQPALTFAPEPAVQPTADAAQDPTPRPLRARSVARPHPRTVRTAKSPAKPAAVDWDAVRSEYASGVELAKIRARYNGNAPGKRTFEIRTQDLREIHAQARAVAQAQLAEVTRGEG